MMVDSLCFYIGLYLKWNDDVMS